MMAEPFSTRYARVVLFGDSITQFGYSLSEEGWCATLANHFQRRADVIHRGYSGYNTRWARALLPSIVSTDNVPEFIVIFFGANDASTDDHQHVPLCEYRDNLTAMCKYLFDLGMPGSSILLVTPPPVHDEAWEATTGIHGNRTFAKAQEYASAVSEVGASLGVGVADVFREIAKKKDFRECLTDGVHLDCHGNEIVAEMVIAAVEERLTEWTTVYPDWTDVDSKNYSQQLRANL